MPDLQVRYIYTLPANRLNIKPKLHKRKLVVVRILT